jgi:hypothetical protein
VNVNRFLFHVVDITVIAVVNVGREEEDNNTEGGVVVLGGVGAGGPTWNFTRRDDNNDNEGAGR